MQINQRIYCKMGRNSTSKLEILSTEQRKGHDMPDDERN